MIRFSDITLNESEGDYDRTNEIMIKDGSTKWMLKTNATVLAYDSQGQMTISCSYVLHFWYTKEVYIIGTDHPLNLAAPDDDIMDLSVWCEKHGWNIPHIHDSLIADPQGLTFWMRIYRMNLVQSVGLKKHDDEEMSRLSYTEESKLSYTEESKEQSDVD